MALLSPTQPCTPPTFPSISLFGAEILQVEASVVTNYSFPIPKGWRYSQPAINVQNATFCNVTVSYTHPGQNDTVVAETWLPVEDWNGRLQSIGGGGWVAGRFVLTYAGMLGALRDGYVTATTDGGVGSDSSPPLWGLNSPGNLNLVALDDLGQTSLNDLSIISKQVIDNYYGQAPSFSYWNGCSQGGRQAATLAQQFPTAYDGIIAAAPALYWAELAVGSSWPPFYMDLTQQYPRNCELTYLTTLAIDICDGLDGVVDGLIAEPELCLQLFDASDYVGDSFYCSDTESNMILSSAAGAVAQATWTGPRFSNGDFMWYGYEIGSDLAAVAGTTCAANGTCVPSGRETLAFWYTECVLKNPGANVTTLTHAQYDTMFQTLKKVFASSMEAAEPGLFEFSNAGGKMITYHGLADPSITPGSTLHYYKEVNSMVGNVTGFYRYYRVPGLGHCWGGNGGQPDALFDQLRLWVENDTAPVASLVEVTLSSNATQTQIICPYPQRAVFQPSCANRTTEPLDCWSCKGEGSFE
ncbi:Tannase/feruloyl esterase [Camillea tinctor]|nr:Tannase/feruloyl esterase [Camillea tinctor]